MPHVLVTIICPIALDRVQDAENEIDKLRNPPDQRLRGALDVTDPNGFGTHFMSLHAVRSLDGESGYLLCEYSADGTPAAAIERIVRAVGDDLRRVFVLASDWKDGADLLAYLRDHTIDPGTGWFDDPGLVFAGTPGMSVGRIRREAELAAHITMLLGNQPGYMHALARVDDVRNRLRSNVCFEEMLTPADAEPTHSEPSSLGTTLAVLQAIELIC